MAGKKRLDQLLVERALAADLDAARRLIGVGAVRVNDQPADKAGSQVAATSRVHVKPARRFVSRGGDKLETALQAFGLQPQGFICADIGASTGGFTDCLLQHGAARVYSVDVGYGLLAWKLRSDPRVIVRDRVNARYLSTEHIPEPLDLAVVDASFISATLLLPPLIPLFSHLFRALILVKPQFQLAREQVGQGGIVRSQALRDEAVTMVRDFAATQGLFCAQPFICPVTGTKGNEEIFLYLMRTRNQESCP
ncbi:MAG: TlyA family RNA methyltransferase [bacterium]|nr:TlyA family RNA methyltransferase [bacterium]